MLGLGLNIFYASQAGESGPPPVTTDFTYTQVQPGWAGILDYASDPAKLKMRVDLGVEGYSLWAGVAVGPIFSIKMQADFFPDLADLIFASVDGGPFTQATLDVPSGYYTIYTGLSNAPHFVTLRTTKDGVGYMSTSGNVAKVTGTAPELITPTSWQQIGDGSTNSFSPNGLIAVPSPKVPTFKASTTETGKKQTMGIKGTFTELWVVCQSRYIYINDGTTTTEYDTTTASGSGPTSMRSIRVTGLSGTKTYRIWASGLSSPSGGIFAVGCVGTIAPLDNRRALVQFGDSVTVGFTDAVSGWTEVQRVAAALDYVGMSAGSGGWTIANLKAAIDGWLATMTVGANDCAVLAIGQNDGNTTLSAPKIADYEYIVDALLTKGYRRVICRGPLPVNNISQPIINASIESIVTGYADARVKYVNPNGWLNTGGIHPDKAGYDLLVGYCLTDYPALLA